jgi:hypothetical protein
MVGGGVAEIIELLPNLKGRLIMQTPALLATTDLIPHDR